MCSVTATPSTSLTNDMRRPGTPRPVPTTWCHKGTSYENGAGQGVTARGSVRGPRPERIPAPVRHGPTSVAFGADRKTGNKKGTNSGPPDRTGRTRRITNVLRTPPRVLNGTAVHCGPPFGTKRPQVQILSPRPCFRRSEPSPELVRACLAACTATKYRQYGNRSEHLMFSSIGLP
jgi:hypothetical protein